MEIQMPSLKGFIITDNKLKSSLSPQKIKSILQDKLQEYDPTPPKRQPLLQVRRLEHQIKKHQKEVSLKHQRSDLINSLHRSEAEMSLVYPDNPGANYGIKPANLKTIKSPGQKANKLPPLVIAAAGRFPNFERQSRNQRDLTINRFEELDKQNTIIHTELTQRRDAQTFYNSGEKMNSQLSRSSSTPYIQTIQKSDLSVIEKKEVKITQTVYRQSKTPQAKGLMSPKQFEVKQIPKFLKKQTNSKHEAPQQPAKTATVQVPKRNKKKKMPLIQINPVEEKIILKYQQFSQFLGLINYSNKSSLTVGISPLKVFIGKGNNHNLIQSLFKQRWWWTETDNIDEAQMVWTQLRANKFCSQLIAFVEDNKKLYSNPTQPMNSTSLNSTSNYYAALRRLVNQEQFNTITLSSLDILVESIRTLQYSTTPMHNHLQSNWHLGNKKALFYNMREYYRAQQKSQWDYMPLTFHVQNGKTDSAYGEFLQQYFKIEDKMWIVKPGEQTNRGEGVIVCSDLRSIEEILAQDLKHPDNKPYTYIIQKYIEKPFLYFKRKFDIRCYLLVTSVNGVLKGYWYQEGYIRTASKEYNLKNCSKMIHLTNDAVQKFSDEYGKHEPGNKISFTDFQRYLNFHYPERRYNFQTEVYPKMKSLCKDTINAVAKKIDPSRLTHSFEIFGLDFMIDEGFKVYLIEVNTNPCLELSSPLLSSIIPSMVENAFRIAVDAIYPPPPLREWPQNKRQFQPDNALEKNKFELIFDELLLNTNDFVDADSKTRLNSD